MRLQCPNCDAEYEVDDAAIPASGRDVQCSACGHAWFQEHPRVKAEAEEEVALFGGPSVVPVEPKSPEDSDPEEVSPEGTGPEGTGPEDTGPEETGVRDLSPEEALDAAGVEAPIPADAPAPPIPAEPVWEPEDILAAEAAAALDPVNAPPEPAEPSALPGPPAPEPEPPRRSIDESILAVLREEAEREAAARRGEQRPRIETQTEMTLPEAPRPIRPAPRAPAPGPQAPESAAPEAVVGPDPRGVPQPEVPRKRTLLPEIEEIKSSLHPTQDPDEEGAEIQAAKAESGFRRGFVFAVFFAVVLLALYVMAPLIVAKVPALQGTMEAYVQGVNTLRRALDTQVRGLIGWLQSLAGGSAG